MVAVLVIAIALGVLQLAFAMHVRHTLTSCASEGARVAAVGTAREGTERASTCAHESLGVTSEANVERVSAGSLDAVRITLTADPPAFSLWRPRVVTVSARALVEGGAGAG